MYIVTLNLVLCFNNKIHLSVIFTWSPLMRHCVSEPDSSYQLSLLRKGNISFQYRGEEE